MAAVEGREVRDSPIETHQDHAKPEILLMWWHAAKGGNIGEMDHDGWRDGVSGSLFIFWDWAVDWIVVEVAS